MTPRRQLLSLGLSFAVGLLAMPALLPAIGGAVDVVWPVLHSWRADSVQRDGADLIVSGAVIKSRQCEYVPPPRARFENGLNVVVVSLSTTARLSWDSDDLPQRFGPWRVPGGAGHEVTFYQHHRCHALWDTITELGVIDDIGKATP